MTATTIKVASEVRDRLREHAARHGRTLNDELVVLLDEEDRRVRFARLRDEMTACPPDVGYADEACEWQSDAWS